MSDDVKELESESSSEEPQEDRIPKSRFDEATGKLKDELREKDEQIEQVRRELQELKSSGNQQTAYTRAQLLEFVDQGQITQAQADEYWEQQIRESASKEAARVAEQQALAQKLQSSVNEYKQYIPGLDESGHENRSKLQRQYNELVSLGHPNDARTEVAALGMVFGPVESIKHKKTADKLTRERRDTHQETGEPGGEESDSKDPVKSLDSRKKAHYQKMVDMGLYKDWGEVRKELERYG